MFSERASWNRNLQPGSTMRALSEGNSAMAVPDSSKAVLSIPRATSRVESVCCWSLGSSTTTKTRRSSRMDGSPTVEGMKLSLTR